jgi:hypothetical protein
LAPAGWIGMPSGSVNGEWMIPIGTYSIFIFPFERVGAKAREIVQKT